MGGWELRYKLPVSASESPKLNMDLYGHATNKLAEDRVQEILWTIEPNVLSEVNRKDVIDYVQRLIKGYYGAKVRIL